MKVRVRYMAQLRAAIGCTEEEIELPSGSSVAELLVHVAHRSERAASHLLADSSQPRPSLLVVVNEAAVPAREAAATMLGPGDIVMLVPPIAGG